jgi:hypothetical protein
MLLHRDMGGQTFTAAFRANDLGFRPVTRCRFRVTAGVA